MADQAEAGDVRAGVHGAARSPRKRFGGRAVQRRIESHRARPRRRQGRARTSARSRSTPVPSGLVRISTSPARAPAFVQHARRIDVAGHRVAELHLAVLHRVAAEQRDAGLAQHVEAAAKIAYDVSRRAVLGKRGDRQRRERPAAHRVDVAHRVGRGDLPVANGSSTIGVKKSTVCTSARSPSHRTHRHRPRSGSRPGHGGRSARADRSAPERARQRRACSLNRRRRRSRSVSSSSRYGLRVWTLQLGHGSEPGVAGCLQRLATQASSFVARQLLVQALSSSSLTNSISMRPPLPLRRMRTRVPSASELLLGGARVDRPSWRFGARPARRDVPAHERFGVAHRQSARDDVAAERRCAASSGEAEQRARVAHRQRAGGDAVAHLLGQPQQAQVLATDARSLPTASAICSWVSWNSSASRR